MVGTLDRHRRRFFLGVSSANRSIASGVTANSESLGLAVSDHCFSTSVADNTAQVEILGIVVRLNVFHGGVANWAVENRKAGSPWQRSFSETDRLAAGYADRAIAHGRFRAGFHLGILKVAPCRIIRS